VVVVVDHATFIIGNNVNVGVVLFVQEMEESKKGLLEDGEDM